jgi:hypothetical protein
VVAFGQKRRRPHRRFVSNQRRKMVNLTSRMADFAAHDGANLRKT